MTKVEESASRGEMATAMHICGGLVERTSETFEKVPVVMTLFEGPGEPKRRQEYEEAPVPSDC